MGLQLCSSEGGDFLAFDWNPIMQTILILSCRGKRSAEPYGFPLLASYHHAPLPLPFLHHLVPTATGEVSESGDGYEVKQTHGLHASSFQSVTRGVAEPAAEEEAEA